VRAYSAPPDPLAVFKGTTSKGRERVEEGEGKGGREGKVKGFAGPMSNCFLRTHRVMLPGERSRPTVICTSVAYVCIITE